jgi:hypothetical protein
MRKARPVGLSPKSTTGYNQSMLKLLSLIFTILLIGFLWFGYQVSMNKPIEEATNEELVKVIPSWFGKAPLLSDDIAQAIYPNIYLPQEQYDEFTSEEMSLWLESVLIYEKAHLKRQEKMHPLVLGIRYTFWKEFRLNEELLAIKEQMEFLKWRGGDYPIEEKVKQFSGKTYGHMTTEEEAREILTHLWQTGEIKKTVANDTEEN